LVFKRWTFNRMSVEHAPDDRGILILWDADEVIYVGRTREETIRSALLRHLDGGCGGCTMRATHYSWEITLWPAAREAQLLHEFARQLRREPRCQPAGDGLNGAAR
jgi:hypothetical protein